MFTFAPFRLRSSRHYSRSQPITEAMVATKAALATIRHNETFDRHDIHFDGDTRYVKFQALWQSKRRFKNDFSIQAFFLELQAAIRNDGSKLFKFYPEINDAEADINLLELWIAAPHSR